METQISQMDIEFDDILCADLSGVDVETLKLA